MPSVACAAAWSCTVNAGLKRQMNTNSSSQVCLYNTFIDNDIRCGLRCGTTVGLDLYQYGIDECYEVSLVESAAKRMTNEL